MKYWTNGPLVSGSDYILKVPILNYVPSPKVRGGGILVSVQIPGVSFSVKVYAHLIS